MCLDLSLLCSFSIQGAHLNKSNTINEYNVTQTQSEGSLYSSDFHIMRLHIEVAVCDHSYPENRCCPDVTSKRITLTWCLVQSGWHSLTRASEVEDVVSLGWVGGACLEDDVWWGHAGHRRGVWGGRNVQVAPGHRASSHAHLCGDDDDVTTSRLAGLHQYLRLQGVDRSWLINTFELLPERKENLYLSCQKCWVFCFKLQES